MASVHSLSVLILTSLVLIAALIDDLTTRKIHNWLSVSAAFIALVTQGHFFGASGLTNAAFGFLAAFALLVPAWLLKWLKAGDVKLMLAIGLAAGHEVVLALVMYSVLWGAVFGLAKGLIQGQGKNILRNVSFLLMMRRSEGLELHSIPYTVPLLFSWLTVLKLENVF